MRGKNLMVGLLVILALAALNVPCLAQDEIKIGAVQPITGRFAFAGVNINAGLEDALMIANEEGGINGKKIKYIMEDGQYQLDVATAAFKRIMSRDNPLIMYGESTGLGKAMSPEIKDRYKILYSSTSFSGELADPAANPYIFVPGPTYGDMFGILLKYIAKEKPGAKVAFFYSDTEFGKDPIPFGREMCKQLKLDLVAEAVAQVGAVDVTSQVLDLKRKNPDFVIFQGFVVDPVQTVIKQCRDFGMKCKFMGTFWGASKMIIDNLGPLGRGLHGRQPIHVLVERRRAHDQEDQGLHREEISERDRQGQFLHARVHDRPDLRGMPEEGRQGRTIERRRTRQGAPVDQGFRQRRPVRAAHDQEQQVPGRSSLEGERREEDL